MVSQLPFPSPLFRQQNLLPQLTSTLSFLALCILHSSWRLDACASLSLFYGGCPCGLEHTECIEEAQAGLYVYNDGDDAS